MATECRYWQAYINAFPPKPDDIVVTGEVIVPNPGVRAILSQHHTPEESDTTLVLTLILQQQPGNWPQVMSCNEARFSRSLPPSLRYTTVIIKKDDEIIAEIDNIEIVH